MPEINTKQRIEFIDLAKGVCIILVLLLHCSVDLQVQLRHVRMPLYFVLSGLFYKSYGGYLNFLVKKINKLIVPFVAFLFAGIALQFSFNTISNLSSGRPILDNLGAISIFEGWLAEGSMVNVPIWFLLSLFVCNVLFFLVYENLGSKYTPIGVVLLAAAGYYVSTTGVYVPLYIIQSLVAMPFFYLGVVLKKTPLLYPSRYDKQLFVFSSIMLALLCLWATRAGIFFVFNENKVGDAGMLLFYAVSIASVVSLLFICKGIKHIPLVSYIGRYSIVVLCVHQLIIEILLLLFTKVPSMSFIGDNSIIMFLVVTFLSVLAIPIMIKFLPWIVAQKDVLTLRNK